MHGRVHCLRLLVVALRRASHNHRVVAHRAADESLLPGKRRRRALADDDDLPRLVLDQLRLAPREVVMIVNELALVAADDLDDLARHPLAPRVRILARELHQLPIVIA